MTGNRYLARGLARQVLGDIAVAATAGDEAARDVIDFKDEILDGWTTAIEKLLDKKDKQLTPDPLGLAARVEAVVEALRCQDNNAAIAMEWGRLALYNRLADLRTHFPALVAGLTKES